MNYVVNDRGDLVPAIGAPASIERMVVERPALIQKVNTMENVALALTLIKASGVSCTLEAESILMASKHRHEIEGHGQYY